MKNGINRLKTIYNKYVTTLLPFSRRLTRPRYRNWKRSRQVLFVICGIAGVKIEKWWKWFIPVYGALFLTQALLIALAVAIGYN
ncbi:MAG: hypothetical protein ACI8WT_002124 [Clostridium sp.]|jgi:hypothetical protein